MRAAGRRGRAPKRWRTTTVPDPTATPPADLIGRDFATATAALNARWCGDITYIHTWEGWLYLATVIDLGSRRVVGWATADHLRTDLIDHALVNAVTSRRPARGVIFHSDRGCQGEFNQSSQHLDHGGVRWAGTRSWSGCPKRRGGSGRRTGRCGRRCVRRVGLSPRALCSGSSGS
jgi:transposase InsO family protein